VEGGVLVFAAQRRTVSIPLRRTRQTTVVLAGAAERFRGAMARVPIPVRMGGVWRNEVSYRNDS
jgi:hypothetical protein